MNFELDSPQIITSKEPNGRFESFSHFWQQSLFKVCVLFYDVSPYFGEYKKKLMWKGQFYVIICNIISGLGLFIRSGLILI